MKEITNYLQAKASLGSAKSNRKFAHCKTGKELVAAWKEEQRKLGRYQAIKLANDNWKDFYCHAYRMIARRDGEPDGTYRQGKLRLNEQQELFALQDQHIEAIKQENRKRAECLNFRSPSYLD